MAKRAKLLLKPGFLATHVRPDCERRRNERIERNNRICESLGVKGITPPSEQLLQKKCANENGKRGRDELDDGDYIPSNDEDDHANGSASIDSFEQAMQTPPSGQTAAQSQREPQSGATMVSERVTRSTLHSDMDTQVLPPLVDQPQSEAVRSDNVALNNSRTRGPTRGKQAQRLIDKDGRLEVPFPPQFRAAVGKHAAKLASKIGFEIRTHVMNLDVRRWMALDDSVKGPILQRLTDKFDLQGDPIDVDKAVATQCGRRISNYTYKLKKKYDKLVQAKGPQYARSNPPDYIGAAAWFRMDRKK